MHGAVPDQLDDAHQAAAEFLLSGLHVLITLPGDNPMMRYSSLFRSRWLALIWCAGIIWMAVDMSSALDEEQDGAANASGDDGAADVRQVQDLVARLKAS